MLISTAFASDFIKAMAFPIEPYTISVTEDKLEAVKQKLSFTNWPDELEGSGWAYGAPLEQVKHLAAYWKESYNWREHETKLNELPNYHTKIQVDGFEALDVHFVHQKSDVENAIPLLFCHGWPGSFLEVTKILPLLTKGNRLGVDYPAFHVVAPSIPNFGFSQGTRQKGFGLKQHAETCHQLMQRLGYNKYVSQGGDWGCMITRTLGILHPEFNLATHINMPRGHRPEFMSNPLLYLQHNLSPETQAEANGQKRTEWFVKEGSGYRFEQSTKPQTLGYALSDSPVGLLAWIYEKLHDWTDDYPWTADEILTWVSVYLFSVAGPAASLRIYYEVAHDKEYTRERTELYIPYVKLGLSHFPKELGVIPRTWGRTQGPVVFQAFHNRGGHFAAHEHPELLVDDLRKMFGRGGGAEGIVEGKNGFRGLRSSKL